MTAQTTTQRTAAHRRRMADKMARYEGALEWYGAQAFDCRKIGSAGDPARQALDADGGRIARHALNPTDPAKS